MCRNTLTYFTAETQARILRRFHFALEETGVLLLGKSEMLITHADLFAPVDLKWRVFRKVVKATRRDRRRTLPIDPGAETAPLLGDTLREAAFDISGAAQVVLDAGGALAMTNMSARRLFNLGVNDFGRLIQDLELSYRPVELRGHLDALATDLRPLQVNSVRWRAGDRERIFDVRISPLVSDSVVMGTSISYLDVSDTRQLQEQLTTSKRELEQAYEELQSTVEELETTNEELENMNEELRQRTLELKDVNAFLETILTTIGLAVLVMDRRQHIQIWNGQARELWGLTAEEVEDQHLQSLDIGLPIEKLKRPLRATLAGGSEREQLVLEATNRRGKAFQCKVTLLPLTSEVTTASPARSS